MILLTFLNSNAPNRNSKLRSMIRLFRPAPLVALIVCVVITSSCVAQSVEKIAKDFQSPPDDYRPDTWFHVIGYNMSKEGLTKDLEAIQAAGLGGIQLFCRGGGAFPNVKPVVPLSPEWFKLMGHAARECERLGLSFTLQNCGGWAMTGGPWVPIEEAQRELVQSTFHTKGGAFDGQIPVSKDYLGVDKNYQDVCVIAFPTPLGDDQPVLVPTKFDSNNNKVAWEEIFNPAEDLNLSGKNSRGVMNKHGDRNVEKVNGEDTYVQVSFESPVTIRSLRIPSTAVFPPYSKLASDVSLILETVEDKKLIRVASLKVPDGCWMDKQYDITLSVPEVTTTELRITFSGKGEPFVGRLFLQSKPRTHNWEAKAAFALRELIQDETFDYSSQCSIDPNTIVDLTDKLSSDRLDWTAPKGDWTILRFGHVNMGVVNGPSPQELQGWETSKLDKAPLEHHLRGGMIGQLIRTPGSVPKDQLNGLLADSWERMIPTWTTQSETLFDEFQQRRGYDLRPFMPAMAGYLIQDPSVTEKFLRDLRETMDDLYVENFFAHFTTIANEMGAKSYVEGATGEVLPGDALRDYGVADIPMTEFWYRKTDLDHDALNYKPVKYAASAAHIYNQQIVAAEACTEGGSNWTEDFYCVKPLIDQHFALGVNHLVFHTFTHNPDNVFPGSTFGGTTGFPFVRNQTWWKHMPSFTDYIARCQCVLQQGEYAADVLWYLGDEIQRPPYQMSPFPDGYQYDHVNAEVLQSTVSVENGNLTIHDGGTYRVLWLRDSKRMMRSTAEKIRELVTAGAVVLGDKPLGSPSLMDDERDLEVLSSIADELWGNDESGMKQTGKGRVYWGQSINDVLAAEAVQPDLVTPKELNAFWHHRKTQDADFCFISSQNANATDACISFRVTDRLPEIWNPVTGEQNAAAVWNVQDGRTHVAISFDPNGSIVVAFRDPAPTNSISKIAMGDQIVLSSDPGWFQQHPPNHANRVRLTGKHFAFWESGDYTLTSSSGTETTVSVLADSKSLNDDWQLAFESGWEAPSKIELDALMPLSEHPLKPVQYYSGTVAYRKTVSLKHGDNLLLDLGTVSDMAEVWCNGQRIGTRWAPPFVFDLSKTAKNGNNDLEIRVTNTWRNQLIFDAGRAKDDKRTWTSNPPGRKTEKPKPYGLIGPVVIRSGITLSQD